VTILTGREGIELHLRAEAETGEEAERRLDALDAAMSDRLALDLYGRDEETLPTVLGRALLRAGRSLATAESCTAGLLAAAITDVPGSSRWYRGGLVVYSDDLKVELAGVPRATLAVHGAVSEPVARALAEGARTRCAADLGVGITGIAGPGGGSEAKPVGTVHLALANGTRTRNWVVRLLGDRTLVRQRTVTLGLDKVRRLLRETAG
jgi:nicotinamide-nucleotide amidase